MNKKIIIGLIIAVLAVAAVYFAIDYFKVKDPLPITVVPPIIKAEKSDAGMGWSLNPNEKEAVKEAATMMSQKLAGNPNIVFVFCASGYDEEKLINEVISIFPEAKIIGGNSGYGVTTPGGHFWYPGSEQSLGLLGVSSPRISWGVGISSIEGLSSSEAAQLALTEAIKDAGKETDQIPDLIISVPSFDLNHQETLEGIAEVVGNEVPVFGSYAADRGILGDWRIFGNEKIYHSGISLAVVYTDLKIGFFKEHGFEVTEAGGVVTQAEERRIIKIDNRPAADVYNELIGGLLSEVLENITGESAQISKTRLTSALNPLAKTIDIPGMAPYYVPSMVVEILPDKSMLLDVDIKEGDKLRILRGDWEILLNRLVTTPKKAIEMADIDPDKILFALNAFCCATHYVIPVDERLKSSYFLNESLGGAPFVGVCGCGIQVFDPLIGNIYTSLGNGILVFSSE